MLFFFTVYRNAKDTFTDFIYELLQFYFHPSYNLPALMILSLSPEVKNFVRVCLMRVL